MKNACILLKKEISAEGSENLIINALSLRGYTLQEIRILPLFEEQKILTALSSMSEEYDNVFLLTERSALPVAHAMLIPFFSSASKLTDYMGARVYQLPKGLFFLLSADEGETGEKFLEGSCVPILKEKYGLRYEQSIIRSVGTSEKRIEGLISEINRMGGGQLTARHQRKYDEEKIALTYDSIAPKMMVDDAVRVLVDGLGDTMYAMNDISLEEQLISVLKVRGKKLSVAESFTGGGIARRITSVSGASEVYFEGVNTYAEEAKIHRLGVSEYTIRTSGAVSDETAYQMALGLLNTGNCNFAIATTGLAGPKSDRSLLPVGLCFIAVGTKEKICVYRYKFDGDRKSITEKAINYALFLAFKQLKDI